MQYIGEHIFPGQFGHFCVVLSFVAALLSVFSYFFAAQARPLQDYPVQPGKWQPYWPLVIGFVVSTLLSIGFAYVFKGQIGSPVKRIYSPAVAQSIALLVAYFFVGLTLLSLFTRPFMYALDRFRVDGKRELSWRNIGRFSFLLHGLATLGIIATLFFILVKKQYEYQYAWANVSDDLPFRFVFSAFWKEQQGSFLLWSFWHIVMSLVLILRAGKWEAPVMTVIALAEVFIASMLLGIYFGDYRFGANPFDLLRDTMTDAPIFLQADYLQKITGNGLNPLLQNYWMTIHPPTLFLGFASTVVPFAFAIAGLWYRDHKSWLKPALHWSLFSGAILGTGILMGGAWAYEALSFGGYWAWDPVENSSLVPWLVMVAGIHTNLVARSTGHSIRSTYAFYLFSFILILYSTYLTRSGILGDSSAHAFTEMGLSVQLILFIGFFTLLGSLFWFGRFNNVPLVTEQKTLTKKNGDQTTVTIVKEESLVSREFWMFIGSLVLLFSSALITGATSLPVFNKLIKIFHSDFIGNALKDPIQHHNRYELWIAIFIGLLSAFGQWLRYNERNWSLVWKKIAIHLSIAAALAVGLMYLNALWIKVPDWRLAFLLFSAMFTLVANADYLITVLRGNLKLAGSSLSHIGFGLLILGIMSTGLNKEWISANTFAMEDLIEGPQGDDLNKNVLLLKEAVMPIKNGFEVTYESDTVVRQTRTFSVRFKKNDANGKATGEEFVLNPNVMYDRQFSKIVATNPSTQHYLGYDIFTHISSLPKAELDPEFAKQQEDSLKYAKYDAIVGDTLFTKGHYIVIESISKTPKHPEYKPENGDLAIGLKMRVYALDKPESYPAEPMLYLRPGQGGFSLPATISQLRMKIRLTEATVEHILKAEDALQYTDFKVQAGEAFEYAGYQCRFTGIEKEVKHPMYAPQQGDVAVAAAIEVTDKAGKTQAAKPVFLIRNNSPYNLKDELSDFGLHFRFENVDPKTGVMTIGVAQSSREQQLVPVEIAEEVTRSDYIVLEAILFPGINFVWAGSIMMLIGLAISLWFRMRAKQTA